MGETFSGFDYLCMTSCLVLVSNDLPMLPSEAQEVINLLTKNKYIVYLLQTGVNSLELYRALQNKPFDLVWIAGHTSDKGFIFKDVLISPTELALFLGQANCSDLILNSCYSLEHVQVIQQICNTNIIATIVKELEDTVAWRDALYLCQALVNTKSLRDAFEQTLALTVSNYRYFPSRLTNKKGNAVNVDEDRIKRVEETLIQIGRIVNGDPLLRVKGLLDVAADIYTNINASSLLNDSWRRDMETRVKALENGLIDLKTLTDRQTKDVTQTVKENDSRIRILERNTPENFVTLNRTTMRLLMITFFISAAIVIAIVFMLRT